METPKVKITVEEGVKILEIRTGEAMPYHEPQSLVVEGTIISVLEYLSKHATLDQSKAFITFNIPEMNISLDADYTNNFGDMVSGVIIAHPIIGKLGINNGKYVTPYNMAELFKMNRMYFENKQVAMELVTQLKNFNANVNKEIDKQADNRGNRRNLIDQVVKTNIPEKFYLVIPFFRGDYKGKKVEVEVYFNADDMTCTLVSPELNELIIEEVATIISAQITEIKKLFPGITIIEK